MTVIFFNKFVGHLVVPNNPIYLLLFPFYTSEVYEGKYFGMQKPFLIFFERAENFSVGYSYLLNTEMTID